MSRCPGAALIDVRRQLTGRQVCQGGADAATGRPPHAGEWEAGMTRSALRFLFTLTLLGILWQAVFCNNLAITGLSGSLCSPLWSYQSVVHSSRPIRFGLSLNKFEMYLVRANTAAMK